MPIDASSGGEIKMSSQTFIQCCDEHYQNIIAS